MEKRLGSSAGVLALVALILHSYGLPGGEKTVSEAGKKAEAAAGAKRGEKAPAEATATAAQGPWRATEQYFHSEPATSSAAVACRAYLVGAKQDCARNDALALYGIPSLDPSEFRTLLATVPDPLHTRMSMDTDRYLDSIQQAAFRSGWELATQWLPWAVKAAVEQEDGAPGSGDGSRDVEKLPGLLVFRRHFEPDSDPNKLLLLFVVGETPTAGLNGFQFEAARRSMILFGSDQPNRLAVAGPNFSGSFPSLTRLIEEDPAPRHYELRAGSVSNSDYARAMLIELQGHKFAIDAEPDNQASISFYASTLPSRSFHVHFRNLVHQWGLREEQAAELVEDETGFSFAYRDPHHPSPPDNIATYRYPRDIAQLRNVYNDSAFASSVPKSDTGPAPDISFSLKDSQSGEDIFPIFSTSHTPVSQNAQLQQIVRVLNRKSIRLVSLSATSEFDTLFLANVLGRYCPDMRIVLRGPDLLFVQEASQGSLSGVMAISTFPLFAEGAAWSHASTNDITTFANADSIGEFDAVSALLADKGKRSKAEPYERSELPDAHAIFSAWLLVLGSSGWLPVDLLTQDNRALEIRGRNVPWFPTAARRPSQNSDLLQQPLPHVRFGWMVLCAALSLFAFAFCGRLLALHLQPRHAVWSALCMVELSVQGTRRMMSETRHSRYLCLIGCFAALAFLTALPLAPMLAARFLYGGSVSPALEWLTGAAFAASLITALSLCCIIPLRVLGAGRAGKPHFSWWSAVLRAAIIGLSLTASYLWWLCCDNGPAGYMLCFRTLTLAAPVCPLWPLLLAGIALFSLAYFHLRRFTWGDRQRPYLETSVLDEALCDEFKNRKHRLYSALVEPFQVPALPGMPVVLVAFVCFLLLAAILLPAESLQSFEPQHFSRALILLLLPLAVFTCASFVRFVRGWTIFRAFLTSLNGVVLGRYLGKLPDFSGSGPVWFRDVNLTSLAAAINSMIALHNLGQAQKSALSFRDEYVKKLRSFLSPPTRLSFIEAYADFRRTAASIAADLGSQVLRVYWQAHALPFVGTDDDEKSAPVPKPDQPPAKSIPVLQPGTAALQLRSLTAAAGYVGSFSLSTLTTVAKPQVQADSTSVTSEAVSSEAYESAAKYVAMQYSVFIKYVLRHLQNLLLCCTICFVLLVSALNSFSFQAPQAIFYFLTAALIAAGGAVLMVLAQMERDPVLSRLSGTPEGELGKDFYLKALAYGALPVLTILSTHFPGISRFVSMWTAPALSAIK